MEEWKEYKLRDVVRLINGRAYSQHELFDEGKYKIVRVGNLSGGDRWYFSNMELSEEKYCIKGDLLYAWACNFGPYIWKGDKTIYHYHIWKLLEDENVVDKLFLFYYLKYLTPYWLGNVNGSVMVHITKGTMEKFPIALPSLTTQQRIAAALKSLDDKIEVNRRINDNLEQQAQALFKYWFVDFEPFKDGEFVESELGMIPKGWRVGMLGEYCKVRSGYAFKSTWWTNEGFSVIKIKNITENGILEMSDCSFVSEEHAELAKGFQTTEGDLLIAMTGATIGKFCVVPDNGSYCVNQRVGKFFLGNKPMTKLPFIYLNFKQPNVHDELINRGQGSAQPNISVDDIETLKIILAPDIVISNFNVMLYPLFKKILSNQQESRRLAQLRDTLLPRLMSGELNVNEITV